MVHYVAKHYNAGFRFWEVIIHGYKTGDQPCLSQLQNGRVVANRYAVSVRRFHKYRMLSDCILLGCIAWLGEGGCGKKKGQRLMV
jgi:hypothetical protein